MVLCFSLSSLALFDPGLPFENRESAKTMFSTQSSSKKSDDIVNNENFGMHS